MKLKNKNIVITGAAGGFGQHLVRLCLEAGANIIALDLNTKDLESISDANFISAISFDVTKKSDYTSLITKFKQLKFKPDVWINNAGIALPKSFDETGEAQYQKVIDVNLKGVIMGTRFAMQQMTKNKSGLIVNLASVAGHIPVPFLSSYVASKHAVVGFTRSLQMELAQQKSNIKLLLVSPGFADTAIMKSNTKEFAIPNYLQWLISTPEKVAKEIIQAIESEKMEIYPVASGRQFMRLYRYGPKLLFDTCSRLLTAENLKQFIGLEPIRKASKKS